MEVWRRRWKYGSASVREGWDGPFCAHVCYVWRAVSARARVNHHQLAAGSASEAV